MIAFEKETIKYHWKIIRLLSDDEAVDCLASISDVCAQFDLGKLSMGQAADQCARAVSNAESLLRGRS